MKKVLGLVMAVAVLGGTLTGCGSSGGGSGKDGYSSAEKAAVAYWEAYYTLGTDKMMKLMPAEAKEHWEDELSLTSEQLTAYMEQELEKKSDIIKTFKSVSVDEQEELSIDRIQNFIPCFFASSTQSSSPSKMLLSVSIMVLSMSNRIAFILFFSIKFISISNMFLK